MEDLEKTIARLNAELEKILKMKKKYKRYSIVGIKYFGQRLI